MAAKAFRPSGGLAVFSLLASLACSDAPPPHPRAISTDSAGVTLVHLPPGHTDSLPTLATRLVFSTAALEDLQLGEGASLAVRFINDTLWAVAQAQEIVILTLDGRVVRKLGRAGEGPGEFQMILSLGVTSDENLLVNDFLTGRVTEVTLDGEVRLIIPRLTTYADGINSLPLTDLPGARLLAVPMQWRPARGAFQGMAAERYLRDPIALLVYDSTGAIVDSVGQWPGVERHDGIIVPFTRSVLYHTRGNVTAIGPTDSLSVSLFEGTALRFRLTSPRSALAPDEVMRATRDRALVASMGELGQGLADRQRNVPGPEHLPVVGGLVLDTQRNIWVGDYLPTGGAPRRWVRYGADGTPKALFRLPGRVDPLLPARSELLDATSGHLLLLTEDEDGEIFVEVHAIVMN